MKTVDLLALLGQAHDLASRDGANVEYDRALVQLCRDAAGITANTTAYSLIESLILHGNESNS